MQTIRINQKSNTGLSKRRQETFAPALHELVWGRGGSKSVKAYECTDLWHRYVNKRRRARIPGRSGLNNDRQRMVAQVKQQSTNRTIHVCSALQVWTVHADLKAILYVYVEPKAGFQQSTNRTIQTVRVCGA
jgi:ribosomal protein S18